MHQHFANVLNRLQTMVFDHSPEQVLGGQGIEIPVETAQGAQRLSVEGEQAAGVRQTTQQVQIEVRLEDRVGRREGVMAAFIAVQAHTLSTQRHALSHDDQRMCMQAVAGAQQVDPLGLLIAAQPVLQLTEGIMACHKELRIRCKLLQGSRPDHQGAVWCIGLL
ncbi:hypothetical protein D3C75_773280 [compost metagenome]